MRVKEKLFPLTPKPQPFHLKGYGGYFETELDSVLRVLPGTRRGAIAKADFSDFMGNARRRWRFQDVEYLRGTPCLELSFAIAPRKI